jgi:hypothetical protein
MCSCQPTGGLVASEIKQNSFVLPNSQFLSGLLTAQVVDPLPLYRDVPAQLLKFSHFIYFKLISDQSITLCCALQEKSFKIAFVSFDENIKF